MPERSRKAIDFLTYLAKNLPEDQAKQIFTEKDVRPLVEALVLGSRDDSSLPRQLSLAGMFIEMGANLTRRLKEDRLGGNIDVTVKDAQKVLIAAKMANLKR